MKTYTKEQIQAVFENKNTKYILQKCKCPLSYCKAMVHLAELDGVKYLIMPRDFEQYAKGNVNDNV